MIKQFTQHKSVMAQTRVFYIHKFQTYRDFRLLQLRVSFVARKLTPAVYMLQLKKTSSYRETPCMSIRHFTNCQLPNDPQPE
jgi:hypothetical protein